MIQWYIAYNYSLKIFCHFWLSPIPNKLPCNMFGRREQYTIHNYLFKVFHCFWLVQIPRLITLYNQQVFERWKDETKLIWWCIYLETIKWQINGILTLKQGRLGNRVIGIKLWWPLKPAATFSIIIICHFRLLLKIKVEHSRRNILTIQFNLRRPCAYKIPSCGLLLELLLWCTSVKKWKFINSHISDLRFIKKRKRIISPSYIF